MDPAREWYPQRVVCYATMNEAAARRKYDQLHEDRPYHDGTFTRWSSEATGATPFHYMDGVDIYVAEFDVNPADNFLNEPVLYTREASVPLGGLHPDLDGLRDESERERDASDDPEQRPQV